jgi:hypothetical protein
MAENEKRLKELSPQKNALKNADKAVRLEDLYCYMVMHNYIYAPTGEMWPASSVDARIAPIPQVDDDGNPVNGESTRASKWIASNRPVEQVTWFPGEPQIIENQLFKGGVLIEHPGVRCFNLYRPPEVKHGNPGEANRWVKHARRVYPKDWRHIIYWLAHRVQRPGEKINHALVLGMGIGKDTILKPVVQAVGIVERWR